MDTKASASALQRLAQKWRAIGLVIIAFARLLRRNEDAHVVGTYEQVRQSQIIVRAAQIMLVQELAQTGEDAPVQTGEDRSAAAFLQMIAVCLLAVHLVLENMIARGLRAAQLSPEGACVAYARPKFAARAGPVYGTAILEPG